MAKPATSQRETQRVPMRTDPDGKAPTQEQIALLAYSLWQARGCPEGTPEEDWFVAERSLKEQTQLVAKYHS